MEHSNYTTEPFGDGVHPIADVRLLYENTLRLSMGIDYFSYLVPLRACVSVPDETGYGIWSYALDCCSLNPSIV